MLLITKSLTVLCVIFVRMLFEKIQVLPLSYIDSHSYGGIVSRVIADADQFADGLLMGFTQLFTGVITILERLALCLVSVYRLH